MRQHKETTDRRSAGAEILVKTCLCACYFILFSSNIFSQIDTTSSLYRVDYDPDYLLFKHSKSEFLNYEQSKLDSISIIFENISKEFAHLFELTIKIDILMGFEELCPNPHLAEDRYETVLYELNRRIRNQSVYYQKGSVRCLQAWNYPDNTPRAVLNLIIPSPLNPPEDER